ncbi:helix-turn-helix transcriptional regulator [Dactylosporangium vinaceum]|uniref:Winged helix-turn-helix transcriptional regulator n=1 Tax=Dactylosporangium vinaceum TaxID=53362 RepID=A0ABV5MAK6_9ACTN|nr:helix-turn-helix domain-containing protein [Dactylosporangium vinaceum]UAB92959.1 helix-turn-helix transcriptional regulator [Dactylosporangium vinaceum]
MSPRIAVPVSTQDRSACAAVDVLRRSGDKWSVLLMAVLESRPYGFNELDRAVDGLSRRILMRTLRTLVRDGLVDRSPQPGPAARVEYTLSDLGRSLLPLIVAVGRWAEEHHDDIRAARARHDDVVERIDAA